MQKIAALLFSIVLLIIILLYCMRETPKESSELMKAMLRLEETLMTREKMCKECVHQRLLVVEQVAQEELRAIPYGTYPEIQSTIETVRSALREHPSEEQMHSLGQKIRKARKSLIDANVHKLINPISRHQRGKYELQKRCKHKLMDVMDPKLNIREVCKSLYLLYDHLTDKQKRCADCMAKHALVVEAYLDEAYSLDKENKYGKALQTLKRECLILERLIHRREYTDAIDTVNKMLEIEIEEGKSVAKLAENYLLSQPESDPEPQPQEVEQPPVHMQQETTQPEFQSNIYAPQEAEQPEFQSHVYVPQGTEQTQLLEHPSSLMSFGVATQ